MDGYVVFSFLILVCALVVSYIFTGRNSPGLLFSWVWLIILLLLNVSIRKFDSMDSIVQAYIALSVLSFCISGAIVSLFMIKPDGRHYDMSFYGELHTTIGSELKLKIVNVAILLTIPVYFYLLGFTPTADFLFSIRNKLTADDGMLFGTFGRYGQMVMVVTFLTSILSKSKKLKAVSVLSAFLINFPLLAKETFCLLFLSVAYFKILTGKETFITVFIKYIMPFIFLMFFIMFIRYYDIFDMDFFSYMFNTYLLSSIPAFEHKILNGPISLDSSHTFRSIYIYANKIGFNYNIPPMLQDFVSTPYMTNVYTFLRPYYSDFGFLGVIFYPSLLGSIIMYLYELAKRGSIACLAFVSLLSYPIVFSFFDERFFTWQTQWMIFLLFCFFFSKGVKFKQREETQ